MEEKQKYGEKAGVSLLLVTIIANQTPEMATVPGSHQLGFNFA